jgi:hypothetical protein
MRPWRLLNIEYSFLKYRFLPLWPEDNICHRIWEKFEVLLGTLEEQVRNLRTLGGNV